MHRSRRRRTLYHFIVRPRLFICSGRIFLIVRPNVLPFGDSLLCAYLSTCNTTVSGCRLVWKGCTAATVVMVTMRGPR